MAIDSGFRKKYDFKSVGELDTDHALWNPPLVNEIPIGFKTPLELGGSNDGIFMMHKSLKYQIRDNFRNLLMTNHGQRLGNYRLGANLEELTHELGTETGDLEAIKRIKAATKYSMPYIEPQTFEAFTERLDNDHLAKVGIRIGYVIPVLGSAEKFAIEVILHSTG